MVEQTKKDGRKLFIYQIPDIDYRTGKIDNQQN